MASASSSAATGASASHWFDPGTIGFELIKGLPAALVALIIGSIAAWVAWQQLKVGRTKLNLDLFEQRYALFELVWTFVSARTRSPEDAQQATIALENALPKFYFLFGREVGDYVSSLLTRGNHQDAAVSMARAPGMPDIASKAQAESRGHATWFHDQAHGLRDRFASYLDFHHWR